MLRVLLAAAAATMLLAAPARAVEFTVNTTADHAADACDGECTVRDALAAADALPGADTITLPAGTYDLGSALRIASDVTISGPATGDATLDAGFRDRVLVMAAQFAALSHLRIEHGKSPDIT